MAPGGGEPRLPAIRSQAAQPTGTDERGKRRCERSDARLERQVGVQQPGDRDADVRTGERRQQGRDASGAMDKGVVVDEEVCLSGENARSDVVRAGDNEVMLDPGVAE